MLVLVPKFTLRLTGQPLPFLWRSVRVDDVPLPFTFNYPRLPIQSGFLLGLLSLFIQRDWVF